MSELVPLGSSADSLVNRLGMDGALTELGNMATQSFDQIRHNSAKLAYCCWCADKIFGLPRGRPTESNGGFSGWSEQFGLSRATAIRYRDMGQVLYEDTGLSQDSELAKLVAEELTTDKVKKLKSDDILRHQIVELQKERDSLTSQLARSETKQAQDLKERVEQMVADRVKQAEKEVKQAKQEFEAAQDHIVKANERAEKSEKRESRLAQKLEKAKQAGRGILMGQVQATIELIVSLETPPTPEEARKLRRLIDVINKAIGSES